MALNFPSSPSLNDQYTSSGKTWVWDGTAWVSQAALFVTPTSTDTLTNKTIQDGVYSGVIDKTGSERSNIVSVGAGTSIDCSQGNYFTASVSANITYTFTNVPNSKAYSFVLEVAHTSGTITWPTSVVWPNNTAPTLTLGRTHLFVFTTDNSGTRWRGASNINYIT